MVAAGMLVAAYVLQADFNRRRPQLASISARNEKDEGFLIIGIAGLAGLIGARLYHVLESPHEFFADPWPEIASAATALPGSAVFSAALLRSLFWRAGQKFLFSNFWTFACRLQLSRLRHRAASGCLLSGDGDYGIAT